MVSRYREEIGRDGPTREAHRRTVHTAGRTALFSGFTVAAAMAALVVLPQRFLYSIAVAGASVGMLSAVLALLVVPSHARPARDPHRRALDPPRPGGLRRVGRLVPACPRRHAPPGRRRARQHRRCCWPRPSPLLWTTLTGPSAEAVPPGEPSYKRQQLRRSHYPRDVTEAVTVTVDGRDDQRQLARFGRRVEAVDGVVRGTPLHPRLRPMSPTRTTPCRSRRYRAPRTPSRRSAPCPAGHGDGPGLRQHRPLHRPEAEPARTPAAGGRDHRRDHPADPLPAHRLGACCR